MKEKEMGIEVKGISPYLFILPIAIGVGVLGFACFIYVIRLSFMKVDLLSVPTFVGLKNYIYALFTRKWFIMSLSHTLYYVVVAVPLNLVIGVGLGVAMYRKIKFGAFFRVAYLIPWVCSGIIIALIFRYIFNPQWGIVNIILGALGFEKIIWTGTKTAIPIVALMGSWQSMGLGMIIFLGAITAIPKDIFQAASLEGANGLQIFRRITLPLLKPTIFFYVVITTVGAFSVFDTIYGFVEGQLGSRELALSSPVMTSTFFCYQMAFGVFAFGRSSAIAILMFLVTLVVILLQRHFIGRKVVYFK